MGGEGRLEKGREEREGREGRDRREGRERNEGREIGRPAKPRRTTSEAVRLDSVAEEGGKRQDRFRERRPEERRGRQDRAQRSRSVGHLEQELEREEEERRGLRRSKSRGSKDHLDAWEPGPDLGRSRSRSKSVSRSRGEIFDDITSGSSRRPETSGWGPEQHRTGGGGGVGPPPPAFSRRQFLVQSQNLQPVSPPLHTSFHSP